MYEAAEDSELLGRVLEVYARGSVLDIGTGSGYLADIAYNKQLRVLAIDANKDVVQQLKKSKPYSVRFSNKFFQVKGTFDTIVCNPPYLPDDVEGTDMALHGGRKGYEYICELIRDAPHYLKKNGQFLFLISSLTHPPVVEKALLQNGFSFSIVDKESLFMEQLYVYKAQLLLGVPATYIGRGKRSVVYKVGARAVKKSNVMRASKEAAMLKHVNKIGIGPRFYRLKEDCVYMQYIEGIPFDLYVKEKLDVTVLKKALKQCRLLDKRGISKQELSRPGKNILVTKKKNVIFLDFERSTFATKPTNVSQLGSWISRLLKKNIQQELQLYKKDFTDKQFNIILKKLFS